jgi:peptidyl-tRNA hydrolase
LVVDRLNEEGEQSSTLEDGFGGRLAQVRIDDQEVLLLKPQTS